MTRSSRTHIRLSTLGVSKPIETRRVGYNTEQCSRRRNREIRLHDVVRCAEDVNDKRKLDHPHHYFSVALHPLHPPTHPLIQHHSTTTMVVRAWSGESNRGTGRINDHCTNSPLQSVSGMHAGDVREMYAALLRHREPRDTHHVSSCCWRAKLSLKLPLCVWSQRLRMWLLPRCGARSVCLPTSAFGSLRRRHGKACDMRIVPTTPFCTTKKKSRGPSSCTSTSRTLGRSSARAVRPESGEKENKGTVKIAGFWRNGAVGLPL